MVNSINTNIAAYFAQANIGIATQAASNSVARLSSGNRIVRSSDDVAALSIGSSLRTSVSALRTALVNSAQGTSLLQIADGALSQITEILQRQKAIALQAGSGSLSDTDRGFLDQEFQALSAEIDRLAGNTNFNGVNLIDGSLSTASSGGVSTELELTANAAGTGNIYNFQPDGLDLLSAAWASTGDGGEDGFYGELNEGIFAVNDFGGTTNWLVQYTLNGVTYTGTIADAADTGAGTSNPIVLTNGAGTATLTINVSDDIATAYTNGAGFETALETAFAGAVAVSIRTGQDETGAGILPGEFPDITEGLLNGFQGSDIEFRSTSSGSYDLPSLSGFAADGFGIGARLSVSVGGVTYTTNAIASDADDIGNNDSFGDGSGIVRFYRDESAPQLDYLELTLNGINSLDLSTEDDMTAFLEALELAFNPESEGSAGTELSFQIGVSATDTLSVGIGAATTAALFEGATLDVTSQENATTASDAVTAALSTIASIRANVGALQSRFNFASAAIQSSIQNQDGARSVLLDTDIAEESTAYATAQVKLQAGISVLAQANQQLQSLLKLIG